MTWEDKIKMAKEADSSLSDEAAEEVVREVTQFAELAYDCWLEKKKKAV